MKKIRFGSIISFVGGLLVLAVFWGCGTSSAGKSKNNDASDGGPGGGGTGGATQTGGMDGTATGGTGDALSGGDVEDGGPSTDGDGSATDATGVITDKKAREIVLVPKPAYLRSYIDPAFGSKVTRITGDPETSIPGITGGVWGQVTRHHYSKTPCWNADETLLRLMFNDTDYLFLDGETYQPLFLRDVPKHARWHPTDPDFLIFTLDNIVGVLNVRTGERQQHIVAGYSDLQLGPEEGNVSRDGRWLAVLAQDSSGKRVAFAYDRVEKKKYPDIDLSSTSITRVDWVSISPLAKYVVFNGDIDGLRDVTQVYDLEGQAVGTLWRDYGTPSHYDMVADANGDEVAIGVAKAGPHRGSWIKRRLMDGSITVLFPNGPSHTSTRNLLRPGWAFGTFQGLSTKHSFGKELIAVRIDGSQTIERFGHVHNEVVSYLSEPHGCPSPTGTRVIWAGNWNGGIEAPIQAYVTDIRPLLSLAPGSMLP